MEEETKAPEAQPDLTLEDKIIEMIKTCYDPEIPVNIYELGLIYDIHVGDDGAVDIKMTLTSPACPAAGSLPPEVENKVGTIEGVNSVKVDVVWEPVWTPEKMTEAARLQLGMF
jgi:FeS assembly SUF system protein